MLWCKCLPLYPPTKEAQMTKSLNLQYDKKFEKDPNFVFYDFNKPE